MAGDLLLEQQTGVCSVPELDRPLRLIAPASCQDPAFPGAPVQSFDCSLVAFELIDKPVFQVPNDRTAVSRPRSKYLLCFVLGLQTANRSLVFHELVDCMVLPSEVMDHDGPILGATDQQPIDEHQS